jgi:hypothetical protein
MKLKSLIFVCCLSLLSSAFADNRHIHPNSNSNANDNKAQVVKKGAQYPGFCEIEIINQSGSDIRVSGYFDDGLPLNAFTVYSYERPHYIDLFYYGYCHAGMNLNVDIWSWPLWYREYSSYTPVGTTITAIPYMTNQVKIQVHKK